MGFKEFYNQSSEVDEAVKRGLDKFIGKTLTAKQDIYIISQEEITSDREGDIFTEKELKKEFLWMKKGFKTELKTDEVFGKSAGFLSSKDGNFDFSEELLDRLLNGRLITIK